MLRSWRRSGLSAREFAKSNGIDAQRLLWWRKRLEATDGGARSAPTSKSLAFIPATLVPTESAVAVTVRLVDGTCIEVADPAAAPAAWVAAVVAALGKVAT
jgi:transposase